MKRQLGPIFTALMLLCAPIAWSQTFTDSVLSAPASPVQVGSTDPTQTGSDSGNTPQDNVPLGILPDNNPPDNGQPGSVPTGPQDTFTHPEQLPALNVFSEAVTNTGLRRAGGVCNRGHQL